MTREIRRHDETFSGSETGSTPDAAAPGGDPALAVALAAASAPVWLEISLLTECRGWMEAAIGKLDEAAAVGTRQEMAVQTALGLSLIYTQSLKMFRRAGGFRESTGIGLARIGMGNLMVLSEWRRKMVRR